MKKRNFKVILISVTVIILLVILVLVFNITKNKSTNTDTQSGEDSNVSQNYDDEDSTYNEDEAINIELNGDSINADSSNVVVDGANATITKGGIYVLSGTLNGSINVNSDDNVRIVLKDASITGTTNSAIYVENAKKVIITLVDGTTNTLKDSSAYTNEEAEAVIYSKSDLIFNGKGTLNIEGVYQDGIVSKDSLKIVSGTYNITAMNNGIKGKDSLEILDGDFTISAENDCIKSTNSEEDDKGYIIIKNGTFDLSAGHDGIQAENYVLIENIDATILSGGGSGNSEKIGKTTDVFSRGMFMKQEDATGDESTENTASYKGIKAGKSISISDGKITIDSADDAVHSNGTIQITSANVTIDSGDDGIHADDSIVISDGTINITKSYEGIEANIITINDGDIDIVSSDDGINVSGGNDNSSMMGRPGQNSFSDSSDNYLTVNGGNIYINASGDGIDSNGAVYVNGGEIYVDGPTDDGNGALDYTTEFVMQGGILVAVGSSGMAQAVSESSTINCLNLTFTSTEKAETTLKITDENDDEIISYIPSKNYTSVVIATSKFETNKTYNVYVDDEKYTTFTVSSTVTNVGNTSNGGFGGGMPRR